MPYANLEDGRGRRKRHGITGARARKVARRGPEPPAPASCGEPRTAIRLTSTAGTGAEVSAPELAHRLGANPKTLRAWLRGQASVGNPLVAGHEHYGRWWFTEAEACQLAEQYQRAR